MEIKLYPATCLSAKCVDIDPKSEYVQLIADQMILTCQQSLGLGLAAPQIGSPWKLFVICIQDQEPMIFCNPKIEATDGEIIKTMEGCLSLPTVVAKLNCRHDTVEVSWDEIGTGERKQATLMGNEAIVFQHEYDHLDGKTLFNRMGQAQRTLKRNQYLKKYKRYQEVMKTIAKQASDNV
jgi:peptide deformylase